MIILGTDYDVVTLDAETFFGTGCSLSLQKLNTFSYAAHPEFTIHGVGVKINDEPTEWIAPADLETRLHEIFEDGDKPVALVAHNMAFDGWLLHYFWDLHPDLYIDTLGMSRGMFPNTKHGLKDLAIRLWPNDETMRKGEELISFRNVTTEQLYANEIMLKKMVEYCVQDVELTYAAFRLMVDHYPDDELRLIDLTMRMHCEPLLHLDIPLLTQAREQWIIDRQEIIAAAGVAESTLSSNPKFLALLEKHGVEVIEKFDPKDEKMKPALGKADLGFQQMRAAHPELAHIFEGRIAAKSTGEIARADRFLETAEICGGEMPMSLAYYGAHSGRMSGLEKMNVQNMKRGSDLRKSLVAPSGHLVLVADSSNIEARMLAWHAQQEDALEVFRTGGDIYSHTATRVYHRPINKHDDPYERFIGKVLTLALGFGQGWRKFRDLMAAGPFGGAPVLLTEDEAQVMVNTYRESNHMIVRLWKEAQLAITDMYLGAERQWGPLKIAKNMLIMPNGMALQYPGLRPMDEHGNDFEYHNGRFWTRIYGPKLCLAKGTEVLTPAGWVPIEEIRAGSTVWDGEAWVQCAGSVYNGIKPVLELAGVTMTPDHEVLTDEGWKTASQSQGHNRAASRLPDGLGVRWQRWEEIPVAGSLRLREGEAGEGIHPRPVEEAETGRLLRLQAQRDDQRQAENARHVTTPRLRRLAKHARSVSTALASCLGQLRRAWHQGLQPLAGIVRELLGGHGALVSVGANAGPHRQRPGLRTGELPVGHTQDTGTEPPRISQGRGKDDRRTVPGLGRAEVDDMLPPGAWLALGQATDPAERHQQVFDLIDCGPRNRFVVRDAHGKPLIVHNCENTTQALSRIVLFDQMLRINDMLESDYQGRVVLSVHDETVAVAPADAAEEAFGRMVDIMKTPPAWCHDLPLDAEGGIATNYSK